MSDWQEIETAPRDGTWIEAWREPSDIGVSAPLVVVRWHHFDEGDPAWVWPDDTYEVYTDHGKAHTERLIARGDLYESTGFTHWRPLTSRP